MNASYIGTWWMPRESRWMFAGVHVYPSGLQVYMSTQAGVV